MTLFDKSDLRSPPPGASFEPADGVSVAELLSLSVPLDWFEGVAIIQGACRTVFATGDDIGPSTIATEEIIIDSAGAVSVAATGQRDGAAAVRRMAEILRRLLGDNFPTALRLTLSQATSAQPSYASLKEFSQDLEYFERPNGTALIQGVYARWRGVASQAVLATHLVEPHPDQNRSTKVRRAFWGRAVRMSAVIAVAAVAAIGLWTMGLRATRAPAISRASDSIRRVGSEVIRKASSTMDAVVDRFIPRPPAASPPVVDVPQEPVKGPRAKAVTPSHTSREQPHEPGPSEARELVPFDLKETPVGIAPPDPAPAVSSPAPEAEPIIYSDSDDGVAPPVAIYPQFPTVLPSGVLTNNLAIIDVVVSESGSVESVKVRRAPETMGTAMLLTMTMSAAKTWRFSPALKNGAPVKYRKVVWVLTH